MARKRSDSRFGFGQFAGSVGLVLVLVGVSQPWLRLDLRSAFERALQTGKLPPRVANDILFALSNGPGKPPLATPRVPGLEGSLGIEASGWAQNEYLSIALFAASLIALLGVINSVRASSAYGARRNSRWLALAGLGALVVAGIELWVLAPQPRTAMRPDIGLWLVAAGAICLLLGALTLGNNRRRPFADDLDLDQPMKSFDNTEHLAYSHGAWVPRATDDKR